MATFQYPYTDFHQMNDDWLILKMKEMIAEWASTKSDWQDMQIEFSSLKSFVENYFDNLDVQNEINHKLDAMAADGSLSDLIAPYVAYGLPSVVSDQIGGVVSTQIDGAVAAQIDDVVAQQIGDEVPDAVTAWLEENVDPVGSAVTIDKTLSIADSAADAKVVGDKLFGMADRLNMFHLEGTYAESGEHTYNLITSSDANAGDTITYNLNVQGLVCYIGVYDGNSVRLAYYGKGSSSLPNGTYSGSFVLPTGFASVKLYCNFASNNYVELKQFYKSTDVPSVTYANQSKIDNADSGIDAIWKYNGYIYNSKEFAPNSVLFTSDTIIAGDILECKYVSTTDSGISYLGFYDASNNLLKYFGKAASGATGTTYTGYIEVPSGFASAKIAGGYSGIVTISKLTTDRKLSINVGDRVTVKSRTDLMSSGSYLYGAFSSGVIFNGKELHATRIGDNHYPTSNRSYIQFMEIDIDGNMKTIYPDIDYTTLGEIDLRDPNLSVSQNGQYLILSAFGEEKVGNQYNVTNSYIFVLDSDYNILTTSQIGSTGEVAWGNTLITPDGYLVKCTYDVSGTIKIYNSDQTFNTSNAFTFTLVKNLPYTDTGIRMVEPTIGFVGDKLVFISRTQDTAHSVLLYTSDLTGATGWSDFIDLGYAVHSPVMQIATNGNAFYFAGSLWLGNYVRRPCIGKYDLATGLCTCRSFDDTINTSGGYPSMINIGGDRFSMVYYEDYNNTGVTTFMYYKRVDAKQYLSEQYIN